MMLSLLKNANLALAFLLELTTLTALCYAGIVLGPNIPAKIGLGIGLLIIAIIVWALYGARTSKRRLKGFLFLMLQIIWFSSAAVALYIANQHVLGIIFELVFVLNIVLAYIWKQTGPFSREGVSLSRQEMTMTQKD